MLGYFNPYSFIQRKILQNLKESYRKSCKASLEKIKASNQTRILDYKLQKQLKILLDSLISLHQKTSKTPLNILFYYPLENEFNCKKLLNAYRKQKKIQIFTPFMCGISFKIVKYRLPLQKKVFGIYESYNSSFKVNKIHIAIIPTLGIDKNFKRIGFGKGMYDRFFETLKQKPINIFICRATHYNHQIITQPHDIQANFFITPFVSLKLEDKKYDNLDYNKLRFISLSRWRWKLPYFTQTF